MKRFDVNDITHIVKDFDELKQWADSRETSVEIAYAIMKVAPSKQDAKRIWENGSDIECESVVEIARKYVAEDEEELYWGEETIELGRSHYKN